jgi:SRSO17 transposase
VTLSIANHHASLPVAYRLYLPKEWSDDAARCRKAGVPVDIDFKTKPGIALEQVHWACDAGLRRGAVLMDAGYGASTELRASITALDLTYVAGILPHTTVWPPGVEPLPAKRWSGHGRPTKLMRRDAEHQPLAVKDLALNLPSSSWRRSPGVKDLQRRFPRGLPGCGCASPIAITGSAKAGQKNGCSSNGRSVKRSRPSIGSRPSQMP